MPLLILLNDCSHPEFIPFDHVRSLSDELKLNSACQFILHFYGYDLRFVTTTSPDYINWMKAIRHAMDLTIKFRSGRSTSRGIAMDRLQLKDSAYSHSEQDEQDEDEEDDEYEEEYSQDHSRFSTMKDTPPLPVA